MKIRKGFVSNSSSTSYVIAVTRNFKPSPDKMQEFLDRCNQYSKSDMVVDIESAEKQIEAIVEDLCNRSQIWQDHDEPAEHMSDFVDIFEDEVQLFAIDSGSEDGKFLNVLADSCKDETMKKLTKLMKAQNED